MKKKFLAILISAALLMTTICGLGVNFINKTKSAPSPKIEQIQERHMNSIELKRILTVNKLETLNIKTTANYTVKLSDKALFQCLQGLANIFTTRESNLVVGYNMHYTYNMENMKIEKELDDSFSIYLNLKDVETYAEQTSLNIKVQKKTFDGHEVNSKEIQDALNTINKEVKEQYSKDQYKEQCLNNAKYSLTNLLNQLNINEKVNIYIN